MDGVTPKISFDEDIVQRLKEAADTHIGRVFTMGQYGSGKYNSIASAMIKAGYAMYNSGEIFITDAGRTFVGGPTPDQITAKLLGDYQGDNPDRRKRRTAMALAKQRKSLRMHTLAVYVHKERTRALQVSRAGRLPPDPRTAWLPRSQILIEDSTRQPFICISIDEWLAKSKNLTQPGSFQLTDEREWSEEDHIAFAWAHAVASKLRNEVNQA